MSNVTSEIVSKIHLVISEVVVIPVAVVYGFDLESSLNMTPETTDDFNFLKAVMGIYLGFSILWILGIFKNNYLKMALVSNVIFMLGLGFGRLASVIFDGLPLIGFLAGTVGELLLGWYGVWVLSRKSGIFAKK
ncbi:MAG: DUF4345 domain-containing protein [Flavobacteriaceae bacterium]|nr:DUF4345 domain-containing protein [Flavobacteriaceae bacterium]